MSEVGIRALKQNASQVVAQVAAGETLTVTDRGRPVALLTPIPASRLQGLIDAGRARPAKRSWRELDGPPEGPSLSDEVQSMRDDERY